MARPETVFRVLFVTVTVVLLLLVTSSLFKDKDGQVFLAKVAAYARLTIHNWGLPNFCSVLVWLFMDFPLGMSTHPPFTYSPQMNAFREFGGTFPQMTGVAQTTYEEGE